MANTLCNYFEIPKRSLCVLPVLPQPDNLSAWIDRLVDISNFLISLYYCYECVYLD